MVQPLPAGGQHPPDFYSVSLVEGHLDIRLNGGGESRRMLSAAKYNDGRLHAFFVIKERHRLVEVLSLRVYVMEKSFFYPCLGFLIDLTCFWKV